MCVCVSNQVSPQQKVSFYLFLSALFYFSPSVYLYSDVTSRSRQTTVFSPSSSSLSSSTHSLPCFIFFILFFIFSGRFLAISTRRVNSPKKSNYLLKFRSMLFFPSFGRFVDYIIILYFFF
jgi:hypothetical protein